VSEDSGASPDGKARRVSWYRSPLSRETLIALNRRSDLLGFLQTAGFLAVLAGTGGVAVWSVGRLSWLAVVLLFLVHGTCSSITTRHVGLLDNVSDFRLSTRTIILNPLLRFLYWHMNFPIEHHKYAAVPCYRLGTLHRLIRHDLPPSPRGLPAAPAMTGRPL
jgi:fatty acid desaturase